MRPFVAFLLILAACGGEEGSPAQAAAGGVPRLVARLVPDGTAVVVDGTTADAVWTRALELVVPLTGDGPPEVRLRAAHDGARLYLQAVWRDGTHSLNRFWRCVEGGKWEKHGGEDALSICWSPGGEDARFREQGCAMTCHGERHVYLADRGFVDFWYWGAQQTQPHRQARDLWLRAGEAHRLRGDNQPEESDNLLNFHDRFEGPKYVPFRRERGADRFLRPGNVNELPPDWTSKIDPRANVGWEVPRDILRPMKGSRGDIAAAGRYLGTAWLVELSRELRTGNPDDQPLGDPIRPALFSVAIHDGTEGGAHAVSGPIELHFVLEE